MRMPSLPQRKGEGVRTQCRWIGELRIAFPPAGKVDSAHADPADRIIAATAMVHKATLLTCDRKLRDNPGLKTAW